MSGRGAAALCLVMNHSSVMLRRIVRAMLTDALKKANESAPRDATGKKQATVLKYVIVPTGIGLSEDEKLPDGSLNRARIVEKFKNRCR